MDEILIIVCLVCAGVGHLVYIYTYRTRLMDGVRVRVLILVGRMLGGVRYHDGHSAEVRRHLRKDYYCS